MQRYCVKEQAQRCITLRNTRFERAAQLAQVVIGRSGFTVLDPETRYKHKLNRVHEDEPTRARTLVAGYLVQVVAHGMRSMSIATKSTRKGIVPR